MTKFIVSRCSDNSIPMHSNFSVSLRKVSDAARSRNFKLSMRVMIFWFVFWSTSEVSASEVSAMVTDQTLIEQMVYSQRNNSYFVLLPKELKALISLHTFAAVLTDFQRACYEGDIEKIRSLPSRDINQQGVDGATLLCLAVQNGHDIIVKELLRRGADIDCADVLGRSPLSIAAKYGRRMEVQTLLANHTRVDLRRGDGATPLYMAVKNGYRAIVLDLLQAGANANIGLRKDNHRTPLFLAVERGDLEMVTLLFSAHRINKEMPDEKGQTPLFVATQNNDFSMVELLVRNGADPNTAALDEWTPLFLAARKGYLPILAFFLSEDGHAVNRRLSGKLSHTTLLQIAVDREYDDVVGVLLEYEADPNCKDRQRETPLNRAIKRGNVKIVDLLLNNGAVVDAVTPAQVTPLMKATSLGCVPVVERLLAAGANVNLADSNGLTALHIALGKRKHELVQLLLSSGADPHKTMSNGYSAIGIANHLRDKTSQQLLAGAPTYSLFRTPPIQKLLFPSMEASNVPNTPCEKVTTKNVSSVRSAKRADLKTRSPKRRAIVNENCN